MNVKVPTGCPELKWLETLASMSALLPESQRERQETDLETDVLDTKAKRLNV